MRRILGATMALALAVATYAPPVFAGAAHSLVDDVEDGPAADVIRDSLRALEQAEEAEVESEKIALWKKGKELAEKALAIDETHPDAHFALFANQGRILQTEGWMRNANHLPMLWRELERTLELDPNHAAALGAKGGLLLQLPWFLGGSVEKAEPLLVRAIASDPNIIGARLELAQCYLQTNRPAEAGRVAEEALTLARRDGKPRYVERAENLLDEIRTHTARAEGR